MPRKESDHHAVPTRDGECKPPVGNAYQGPTVNSLQEDQGIAMSFQAKLPTISQETGFSPSYDMKKYSATSLNKTLTSSTEESLEAAHNINQGHQQCHIWYNCPELGRGSPIRLPD